MIIDALVTELKVYLKIKETDVDNDAILLQAATAAAAYIEANYSYNLIDVERTLEFYALDGLTKKFYLQASPTISVVPYLDDVEVIDNTYKLLNNMLYFSLPLGQEADLIKFIYQVGLQDTDSNYLSDIAQACSLAGYFYKQADKGLVGVEQYGTGIKESARLYEGIPRAVLDYFQMRKLYRL